MVFRMTPGEIFPLVTAQARAEIWTSICHAPSGKVLATIASWLEESHRPEHIQIFLRSINEKLANPYLRDRTYCRCYACEMDRGFKP